MSMTVTVFTRIFALATSVQWTLLPSYAHPIHTLQRLAYDKRYYSSCPRSV